ncbi:MULTISPECIES: hypothetical protein [Actinomadura]|uniref:Uncharacterized protein n=1 Tax=Actinomadura yumaensis TaxID=111807 RepID=A0ABW2CGG5_9ACTN|nr:hypothetical protein [Actinomadura sp. J1-007]MWK34502.1 hypothetical protein [Actinomadura sp. J1-007]
MPQQNVTSMGAVITMGLGGFFMAGALAVGFVGAAKDCTEERGDARCPSVQQSALMLSETLAIGGGGLLVTGAVIAAGARIAASRSGYAPPAQAPAAAGGPWPQQPQQAPYGQQPQHPGYQPQQYQQPAPAPQPQQQSPPQSPPQP